MTLSDFATFSTVISGIAVRLPSSISQSRPARTSGIRGLDPSGLIGANGAIVLANQTADASAAWVEGNVRSPLGSGKKNAIYSYVPDFSHRLGRHLLAAQRRPDVGQVFARNCYEHSGLLSQPGFRAYWNSQRADLAKLAPKFTAFVDGLCVGRRRIHVSSVVTMRGPATRVAR